MDTKWKKIRNNTMLKVCTFLLACVFAFSTFYSLSYMALFSIKYKNTTDFSVFFEPLKDDGYTVSKMFTRQFSNDAKIIKKMMTEYKNDENVRSGNAFKSKEAKLKEQMEKEIEQSIASQKNA